MILKDNHLHTDNSTSIETFRWQICDFLLKMNNVFQCYEVDNDVHCFTRQISMVLPHNEKIKTLLVLSSIKKIYARQCYRYGGDYLYGRVKTALPMATIIRQSRRSL